MVLGIRLQFFVPPLGWSLFFGSSAALPIRLFGFCALAPRRITYLNVSPVPPILTRQSLALITRTQLCRMQPVGTPVRNWLRLEALTVTAAGLMVWAGMGGGWVWFVLLILVPDVSLVGYVWGARIGAAMYNAAHNYALPLLFGVVGGALDHRLLVLMSSLWITHIGIDRTLGYGLKYVTSFADTHLGRVGRKPLPSALLRTGEHLGQLLNTSDTSQKIAL